MKMPRRVLIVQPYGIGDLLFLTPVLRALRLIPGIEIVDLLLGSRTEAVIRSNPHIDKIFSLDKGRWHGRGKMENFRELRELGRELSKRRYDFLLDYSLRGEYAFFARFFLGIPHRAGFAYKDRGFFHNIHLPLPEGFSGRHTADSVCDLAEKSGIPVDDRFLEFYAEARDREAADFVLKEKFGSAQKPYVTLSPGGGESWGKDAHFKRWPPAFFAAFLNLLKDRISFENILIVGSSNEKELAAEVVRGTLKPAVNMCGEVSFETAAALIEKSALFIGNDGGLVHLACALQRPVIAFYGPVDPAVYGPYPEHPARAAVYKEGLACRPCYKRFRYKGDCATRECLQNLQPGEVIRFLERRNFFSSGIV